MGSVQVGWKGPRLPRGEGESSRIFAAREVQTCCIQGTKGLDTPAIKHKLSLRCSLTGSIFLDSVLVGHDALLPHGMGLGAPFGCLNSARSVESPCHSL